MQKKKWFGLALAGVLCVGLCACGGATGTGSSTKDARHWNPYVLKVFEEHSDTLSELFNK